MPKASVKSPLSIRRPFNPGRFNRAKDPNKPATQSTQRNTKMPRTLHKEIGEIAVRLRPLFIQNRVEQAILFGSMGRGSATRRSDLDLMIVMNTEKRFFDRYEQFDKIHEIIDDRSVDILIYSPDELRAISHRPFIKKIFEEGVTIYER